MEGSPSFPPLPLAPLQRWRSFQPDHSLVELGHKYEVDQILRSCIVRGRTQYLVKWKNYATEEATGQTEADCENCKELVKIFEAKDKTLGVMSWTTSMMQVKFFLYFVVLLWKEDLKQLQGKSRFMSRPFWRSKGLPLPTLFSFANLIFCCQPHLPLPTTPFFANPTFLCQPHFSLLTSPSFAILTCHPLFLYTHQWGAVA